MMFYNELKSHLANSCTTKLLGANNTMKLSTTLIIGNTSVTRTCSVVNFTVPSSVTINTSTSIWSYATTSVAAFFLANRLLTRDRNEILVELTHAQLWLIDVFEC